MKAKKKHPKKPQASICKTCHGQGWLWSGQGHFGEQEGGLKAAGSHCPECMGLGRIEEEEIKVPNKHGKRTI
jgi:hypothetical protein